VVKSSADDARTALIAPGHCFDFRLQSIIEDSYDVYDEIDFKVENAFNFGLCGRLGGSRVRRQRGRRATAEDIFPASCEAPIYEHDHYHSVSSLTVNTI
jgi:hypothetical protein